MSRELGGIETAESEVICTGASVTDRLRISCSIRESAVASLKGKNLTVSEARVHRLTDRSKSRIIQ